MAVGFTPKHIEEISLNDLNQEQFLGLAIETANKIGWEVGYISDAGFIAYTKNGMFSWNAEVKVKIEHGIANINSSSIGSEMIDWGKNKKNVNNFISSLEEMKSEISKDELNQKYQELKEHLVSQEDDILKLPPATTTEQIKDFFSIFIPTEGFFITPILLDINILIFIIMAITGVNIMMPDNESLLLWGANFRPMTLEGEWWRLFTSCFLHIGIFHLLMNMYALLYIGVLLEPILGRGRFLTAYILTGITASIVSLWWHDLTISAGASGAIFGMYGVFLALLTTNLIEKNARKALLASIAVFVGYNLINGLKGGIDNAAHIGGLIGGLVIGYAFIPSLKKNDEPKLAHITISLLAILVLGSTFFVYNNLSTDIGKYDKRMKEFISMEAMAMEIYNLPQDTPKEKLLSELKDRGLYYWNENKKLINEVDELNLPDEIHKRNSILKKYCDLRIKSYDLIYKGISEDTNQYESEINKYTQEIESLISELNGEVEK